MDWTDFVTAGAVVFFVAALVIVVLSTITFVRMLLGRSSEIPLASKHEFSVRRASDHHQFEATADESTWVSSRRSMADPREWPRLRGDRFRSAPRIDVVETEADLARWRRWDRIERILGIVAVAIALAIPLEIIIVLIFSVVSYSSADHKIHPNYEVAAIGFAAIVSILLVVAFFSRDRSA
jgi:hypothetical protein